jgi:hypothetical protein
MAGDDGRAVHGQVALGDVQVRAADAARLDSDEELAWRGRRRRPGDEAQRVSDDRSGVRDHPRLHW